MDKEGKTELMQKCVHKAYQRGYDMGVLQTTNKMNHNTKEGDLKKEITNFINRHYHIRFDEILERGNDPLTTMDFEEIAKHFYELGLNAQHKISYIPNIDDTLKELGIDIYSNDAKIFKEVWYSALGKFLNRKEE